VYISFFPFPLFFLTSYFLAFSLRLISYTYLSHVLSHLSIYGGGRRLQGEAAVGNGSGHGSRVRQRWATGEAEALAWGSSEAELSGAARRSSRSAALSDDTCDDEQSSGLGARVM
jgi:hypothetical protein